MRKVFIKRDTNKSTLIEHLYGAIKAGRIKNGHKYSEGLSCR
jgi:hypothetical protein